MVSPAERSCQARFLLADYSCTLFADGSFDVVWGLESVVHAESQEQFIREAARLSRPGGRLLIAEYTARESPPLSEAEERLIASGLHGWAMTALLTPGRGRESEDSSAPVFLLTGEWGLALREAVGWPSPAARHPWYGESRMS